ncbi:MAG: hypothetical protein H0W83_15830 [Planctomycetes bacterium]|nr:hypothetical protein [Planctomycetota bacterium]
MMIRVALLALSALLCAIVGCGHKPPPVVAVAPLAFAEGVYTCDRLVSVQGKGQVTGDFNLTIKDGAVSGSVRQSTPNLNGTLPVNISAPFDFTAPISEGPNGDVVFEAKGAIPRRTGTFDVSGVVSPKGTCALTVNSLVDFDTAPVEAITENRPKPKTFIKKKFEFHSQGLGAKR